MRRVWAFGVALLVCILGRDSLPASGGLRWHDGQKFHRENHAAQKAAWEQLRGESAPRLLYLEGDALLGGDAEEFADGYHPNVLGLTRQADALELC